MQPHIRAGILVEFEPTVRVLGGDISQVLEIAEQPRDVLKNPESFIPYRTYLRLLSAAAQCTGCPHFGLAMSRELGANNMGVTGFVMTQAPDVGSAWRSLQRFYHVHDTYGTVVLTEVGDMACIRYEIPLLSVPGAKQSLDVAAGISNNMHRMLVGKGHPVTAIHFTYPRPDDLSPFEFLDCDNLLFDQPGYAMFFPAVYMGFPVASADSQVRGVLDAYLETLELSSRHVTSRQVEKLIRDFLPTGNCTLPHVAAFLSLSVRTLQNRLEDERTSFQLLLEKVRRELAINHLSVGDMQLTQLAYLLGYSELSAFSRSFKRWYGTSPRNWQKSAA